MVIPNRTWRHASPTSRRFMPNLLLVSHSAASSIYDEKFKAMTKEKADSQAQVDAVEQAAQQDQNRNLFTVLSNLHKFSSREKDNYALLSVLHLHTKIIKSIILIGQ